jgi:orsellinic acid C2-O-methyltransferase
LTPGDRAYQLVNGFRISQVVHAAAELRIPDLLASHPMTASELSVETQIEMSRLQRLLRALVSLGVLAEGEDGSLSNTEVGELFRENAAGSRRATSMMLIPESYRAWDHFMEVLRTGAVGHVLAHGGTLWETIARDPDFAARFNNAMAANSNEVADFVASSVDFSGVDLVVDVAGGEGALLGGILVAHPRLRGIVCDLPAGLEQTSAYLAWIGVVDRCDIVECDFFQSVPKGGGVYLLKDIIHDWDDEAAAKILAVVRNAMAPGARVVIVERLVPSPVTNSIADFNAVMTDLQMMVQLGSRERTLGEFRELLGAAGFEFARSAPGGVFKVIEAVAS